MKWKLQPIIIPLYLYRYKMFPKVRKCFIGKSCLLMICGEENSIMGREFKETSSSLPDKSSRSENNHQKLLHICEVCGKQEILTSEEGYKAGWDYAPRMYPFKIISPRTCNQCGVENTAWWQISVNGKTFSELSDHQKETVKRIYNEPESILLK